MIDVPVKPLIPMEMQRLKNKVISPKVGWLIVFLANRFQDSTLIVVIV